MLTCLFHDPGYVAENYWGTFQFSHGFTGLEAIEENEIPEVAKRHIRNAWDINSSVARNDLWSFTQRRSASGSRLLSERKDPHSILRFLKYISMDKSLATAS